MALTPGQADAAARTKGFMPEAEAEALHDAALSCAAGPFLEVGTYCGKSSIWLGAAAQQRSTVLFTVDHHHGSEENQFGWQHHDPDVVDASGRMETLPFFRRAMSEAGLEDVVVAVVGRSAVVGAWWSTPVGFLFIDGGHGDEMVKADEAAWLHHVRPGGTLAIHDVFADPSAGGQAPYGLFVRALESGRWAEHTAVGSLRVLRRL